MMAMVEVAMGLIVRGMTVVVMVISVPIFVLVMVAVCGSGDGGDVFDVVNA